MPLPATERICFEIFVFYTVLTPHSGDTAFMRIPAIIFVLRKIFLRVEIMPRLGQLLNKIRST